MGEAPHELVQRVDEARSHLDRNLQALQDRVREESRRQIRSWEQPAIMVGAAVLSAVLIGFVIDRVMRS